MTIDTITKTQLLGLSQVAATKKDPRHYLRTVHATATHLTATDGKRLIRIAVESKIEKPFLVDVEKLKPTLAMYENHEPLIFTQHGDQLCISRPDSTLSFPLPTVDGTYPDINQKMQQYADAELPPHNVTVGVDLRLLKTTAAALEKIVGKNVKITSAMRLDSFGPIDGLRFEYANVTAVLMPIRL